MNGSMCALCGQRCGSNNSGIRLLDGRILCVQCEIRIRDQWYSPMPAYTPPVDTSPSSSGNWLLSMLGFRSSSDCLSQHLAQKEQYEQGYLEQKKKWQVELEAVHGICDVWPEHMPPDWNWRRFQVLKRSSYSCSQCGSDSRLHVHHVVPFSRGGTHHLSNLTVLCERCHSLQGGTGHDLIRSKRRNRLNVNRKKVAAVQTPREAKKDHLCARCGDVIPVGELYIEWHSGGHMKERLCMVCSNRRTTAMVEDPGAFD